MAEGDNELLKVLNFFSPANLYESIAGAVTGQNEDLQNNPAPSAMDRVGSVMTNSELLKGIGDGIHQATQNEVVGGPLKFVLDFGNRTADSLFTAGQAEDDNDPTTTFTDGWVKGWNSWGQADHLTAGQIAAANINNGFQATGLNPFTPQGVKDTRTLARTTWYGDVAGVSLDISAGFLVPGPGIAKIGRAGKTIDTLQGAENVAEAFNTGQRAGRTGALFQPSSPAAQATRIEQISEKMYERAASATDLVNFIAPLTSGSVRGQRLMASMTMKARETLTPVEAKHAIGNIVLGSQGSDAARAVLINDYPLIASMLANGTTAPQHFEAFASASEKLHAQYVADPSKVNINQVLEEVMNTPRKTAEMNALKQALERSKEEAIVARDLKGRLAALRPRNRTTVNGQSFDLSADNLTIKEARIKTESQYNDLKGQLDEAKANHAAAPTDVTAQRVNDLKQRLGEARADRDLLRSTPLDEHGYTLPQWRKDMANSRGNAKIANRRTDMLTALHRTAKRELASDAKAMQEMYPGLSAQYDWLADIDALGRPDSVIASMRIVPSRLDRMKTAIRDEVGASYLYDTGEFSRKLIFHVMPKSWVANIGTAYGRSAINALDRYVGAQELGMYLKKSKVYAGDEIKAATEEFHRVKPDAMEGWIERLHEDMLTRIIKDEAPHLDVEQVRKAVASTKTGMRQHREYQSKALKDAGDSDWALLHEFPDELASDAGNMVPSAFLRSHLAETVPFADPVMIRKEIQHYDNTNFAHIVRRASTHALDMTLGAWKISSILRPGMMVRNALDSNLRAYAIMGTIPTVIQATKGSVNLARNTGLRVGDYLTARKANVPALRALGAQDPAGVARNMLNETTVKYKGQKLKGHLYDLTDEGDISRVAFAQTVTAYRKGMAPSEGIIADANTGGVKFTNDSKSWEMYQPSSKEWARAYADGAQVLLASPTAREIMRMASQDAVAGERLESLTSELFSKPAVRDEYARLRETHNLTQQGFVETVLDEAQRFFPEPGMAQDLLAGKFRGASGKAWIESHFPKDQRFLVPGKESMLSSGKDIMRLGLNRVFNALQDLPDLYLARHPVAYYSFEKQFAKEARALVDARMARNESAVIDAEDIAKIQARARNHAITTVRDYMYDATKQTGVSATATMHRLVPFLTPWADTMRAYSRLLYDDPTRLAKIAGVYNTPFNASAWMQNPIIIDQYGNALGRSERDVKGGAYVVINGEWGKNKTTGRQQAKGGITLRASSFNTVLQGGVPWMPGWGPLVQIPVQTYLNNDKDLALKLASSDNPAVKTLMDSLFLDGEVPDGTNALWKTAAPAWLRNFVDEKDGVTWGRNTAYLVNQKFMEAQSKGIPFDSNKAMQEAQSEATSAAWVGLVSRFGFGISGSAQMQGEFYVQKLHEFQSLSQKPADGGPSPLEKMYGTDSPTAAFAKEYPEADGLSWSFTRNETGISATVDAQNAAMANKALIDANPNLGWFILGGDNVGGDFSQTAYNQQKQDTYGATQQGRKQMSNGEIAQKVQVSQGWVEFTKYTTELARVAEMQGLDPKVTSFARQAIIAAIGQHNPSWFAEFNDRKNKAQDFYQRADLLAGIERDSSGNLTVNESKIPAGLRDRQDIAMYAMYRRAQEEVLRSFGLKSFAGTSANSEAAKWAMYQIGTRLAQENIGFQQMWERTLLNDVEPSDKMKAAMNSGG